MHDIPIKLNWKNILLAIMAALLIFATITNANQANEIEMLNNRINNLTSDISNVRGTVSSIYNNVDEQLKKQASLLTSVDFTLGELDTEKHTIDVELKIVPKTVTENMALSVRMGDTVVVFKQNGNEFSANIPVNMFSHYKERPMLYIESDVGTHSEVLEDINLSYLYFQNLPFIYVEIGDSANFKNGNLEINSHLHVSTKPTEYSGNIAFIKYELVIEVDDKEIEREDVTSKIVNGYYDGQFQKTVNANLGDEVVIYVEAEDSLGYIHKTVAYTWYKSDNSAMTQAVYEGDSIYDKEGNVLFGG